jgi:hypothetical protein
MKDLGRGFTEIIEQSQIICALMLTCATGHSGTAILDFKSTYDIRLGAPGCHEDSIERAIQQTGTSRENDTSS